VWITPATARTALVLRQGGLQLAYARDIDLGGYEARLERWQKPARASRPAGKPTKPRR
jgi:hypothetical protein